MTSERLNLLLCYSTRADASRLCRLSPDVDRIARLAMALLGSGMPQLSAARKLSTESILKVDDDTAGVFAIAAMQVVTGFYEKHPDEHEIAIALMQRLLYNSTELHHKAAAAVIAMGLIQSNSEEAMDKLLEYLILGAIPESRKESPEQEAMVAFFSYPTIFVPGMNHHRRSLPFCHNVAGVMCNVALTHSSFGCLLKLLDSELFMCAVPVAAVTHIQSVGARALLTVRSKQRADPPEASVDITDAQATQLNAIARYERDPFYSCREIIRSLRTIDELNELKQEKADNKALEQELPEIQVQRARVIRNLQLDRRDTLLKAIAASRQLLIGEHEMLTRDLLELDLMEDDRENMEARQKMMADILAQTANEELRKEIAIDYFMPTVVALTTMLRYYRVTAVPQYKEARQAVEIAQHNEALKTKLDREKKISEFARKLRTMDVKNYFKPLSDEEEAAARAALDNENPEPKEETTTSAVDN